MRACAGVLRLSLRGAWRRFVTSHRLALDAISNDISRFGELDDSVPAWPPELGDVGGVQAFAAAVGSYGREGAEMPGGGRLRGRHDAPELDAPTLRAWPRQVAMLRELVARLSCAGGDAAEEAPGPLTPA